MIYNIFNTVDSKPPTLYSLMESMVNYSKEDKTRVLDLASEARIIIFNFNYPLTDKINKEIFEKMILNKFMMRRIGYETYLPWRIALEVKLNEIMPKYNIMFEAIDTIDIFKGETTTREYDEASHSESSDEATSSNTISSSGNSSTESSTSSESELSSNDTASASSSNSASNDKRFSDTPQNNITEVQNGNYITNYTLDANSSSGSSSSNSSSSSSTDSSGSSESVTTTSDSTTSNSSNNSSNENDSNKTSSESINRTVPDYTAAYRNFQEAAANIYSLIFNELEILFYSLI